MRSAEDSDGVLCRWETARAPGAEWDELADACWRGQAVEAPVSELALTQLLFVCVRTDVAPRPPPLLLPTPPPDATPAPDAAEESLLSLLPTTLQERVGASDRVAVRRRGCWAESTTAAAAVGRPGIIEHFPCCSVGRCHRLCPVALVLDVERIRVRFQIILNART